MGKLRHRGAEAAEAGTFWNFETGEKVTLKQRGLLPGNPSQSYYKLPPMLILALAAVAAHLVIYVLPKFLVQFYAAHTEKLVTSYVVLDFVFIAAVIIGITMTGAKDMLSGSVSLPSLGSQNLATSKARKNDSQRRDNR